MKRNEYGRFERYVAEQKFLAVKEGKKRTIKALMEYNFSIELIAKVTRVSAEKVNELLKEIEKLEKEGYF